MIFKPNWEAFYGAFTFLSKLKNKSGLDLEHRRNVMSVSGGGLKADLQPPVHAALKILFFYIDFSPCEARKQFRDLLDFSESLKQGKKSEHCVLEISSINFDSNPNIEDLWDGAFLGQLKRLINLVETEVVIPTCLFLQTESS